MMLNSYPQIFALGHRYIKDLFLDDVLIEEKVDGSQFSFGRMSGELFCRSKGCKIHVNAPGSMFSKAVESVSKLDLHDGWTYRGEYLQKPKHNALAYSRIPNNHVIIFDINTGLENYLTYDEKKRESERIGLEIVPILYYGKVDNPETLLSFLEHDSILGGQKIEGVVVKNYSRFGQDKKVLMGKYVSEKYKEVHNKEWGESNPKNTDIVQSIVVAYRTDARWMKAVQHLKERGELTDSPKDIGLLIKEAQSDIVKECADEIKELLWNKYKSTILRGATSGLPEWYKQELLGLQFDDEMLASQNILEQSQEIKN